MDLPQPPRLDARGPTLSTMHEIESILRSADEALSLNEIKRRMKAKAVRHDTVRMAIEDFKRRAWVTEGEKGVLWTLNTDPRLRKHGRQLSRRP